MVTQRSKPIVKMDAANDELPGNENINYLQWYSKNAVAGDDLLVVDDDGDTVWPEVADGPNWSRIHIIKNTIKGLKIQTIDSGYLLVIRMPRLPKHF